MLISTTLQFTMVVIAASMISCGGSSGKFQPLPGPGTRSVLLRSFLVDVGTVTSGVSGSVESAAPVNVGIRMGVTVDNPPGGGDAILKFEVDFGEGGGWEDVTDEARIWDFSQLSAGIDPARLTTHVYDEPGQYLLQGRITCWDGEVLTTAGGEGYGGSSLPVTVLP